MFFLKILQYSQESTCVGGLRSETLLKNKLQHWCFPANIAKFSRTPILKNSCEQLLLKGIYYNECKERHWISRMTNSETLSAKRCKVLCLLKNSSSHMCFPVDFGNFQNTSFAKHLRTIVFIILCLIFEYCGSAFPVLQISAIWRIEVVSSAFYDILI